MRAQLHPACSRGTVSERRPADIAATSRRREAKAPPRAPAQQRLACWRGVDAGGVGTRRWARKRTETTAEVSRAGAGERAVAEEQWAVRAARVKDGWAVHHLLHVVFRGRDVETEEKAKAEEPRTPLDAPLAQALLLPVVALKRAGYYLSSKALYYVRLWSFVLYAVPHWVLVVEKATERKGGVVGSCDLTLMPASATVPVLEALRDAQQVPRGRQVLYLSNMAVAPRARRSGVASALLRSAIAQADKLQSVGLIALFVLPDNQGAIQLYEQLGWRRITSVPNSTPPGQLLLVRQHPAGK